MRLFPKTFQDLQWHFRWEIGKDVCVNEDKEGSPATERLLVHMSEKKCANLPSTPHRVCLPETHEV